MVIADTADNPLIPKDLLRKLAGLTRELRVGGRRRGGRGQAADGLEALRAAAMLTLAAGDVICDLSDFPVGRTSGAGKTLVWLQLPTDAGVKAGWVLLGAALAMRGLAGSAVAGHEASGGVLLALVPAPELRRPEWRAVAEHAARATAPMVLVALPGNGRPVRLPRFAGLPTIPVDAADAVALCRVIGESCLRARNGDGPALILGVRWQIPPA